MRGLFQNRVGMAVAFVLGLVIAAGATAGATSLITGRQIQDGSIGAKDLSKPLQKRLARSRAPGPRGAQGPQGAKGDPGADAGQVVASVGADVVGTSACANNTLLTAGFTLSTPAYLLTVFGGAWTYAPASGRVDAILALRGQGQLVGVGGREVIHRAPPTTDGQADWTGFIHASDTTFDAKLVPAGTYSLTATPEELGITCGTAGQWSGVSMTVIAVRPAP